MYATGWVRRGPSGVISTNKGDAEQVVETLIADWKAGLSARSTDGGTDDGHDLVSWLRAEAGEWGEVILSDKRDRDNGVATCINFIAIATAGISQPKESFRQCISGAPVWDVKAIPEQMKEALEQAKQQQSSLLSRYGFREIHQSRLCVELLRSDEHPIFIAVNPCPGLEANVTELHRLIDTTRTLFLALGRVHAKRFDPDIDFRDID